MGHHPFTLLSKLTAIALLLAASAAAGAEDELGADLQEVTGVQWPRFDPETGKRVWVVSAEKAWATGEGAYKVKKPHVVLYGSDYDITITSDSGLVKRKNHRNNSFVLEGGVKISIDDPGQTVVKAERLEWLARKQVLQTDSAVSIDRKDIDVKGKGLELKPEKGSKKVRLLRLKQNVQAAISEDVSTGGIFSGVTGKQAEPEKDQADTSQMFISSDGALTINRDTSVVTFHDNVEVKRKTLRVKCDKLQMAFDPETTQIRSIQVEGGVKAFDGPNGASGKVLSWDALTGLVELVGEPAKTWRAGATVSAPVIWISQDDGRILWTGRAHLFAPPEGPASLMRFGGGSE
jgi:LPS export ABC transporter protein LptC